MRFRQPYFYQVSPDDPNPGGGDPAPADPAPADPVDPPKGDWPDNWRELAAGDDEKKLAVVSRYASPAAAIEGLVAFKQKLSSGEFRSAEPYPSEGTEEEQAAWRESHGIPSKAEEYGLEPPTEDDKAFIEEIQKFSFENNIPKEHTASLVKFLIEQDEAEIAAEKDRDAQARQASEDTLRNEWGADYRRNINIVNSLFDGAPEGLKDNILGGRLSDGTKFGDNPELLKYFVDLALKVNPVSTVVTASNGNYASTIDDEITKIDKLIQSNDPAYWKDEKVQARYRELIDAKEQLNKQ